MIKILEGKTLSKKLSEDLKSQIRGFESVPCLAIFQVGDNKESNLYIEKKKEYGKNIGVEVRHIKLPEDISQQEIEKEIKSANQDPSIHGIIIQLPLPNHLDSNLLIEKLDYQKDVDGLTSFNVRKLLANDPTGIIPATAKGVMDLIDYYEINLEGKNTVVIGRSALVGKPVALSFLNRNATVTICHRKTQNLQEITKKAHVIVTAMGQPEFINKNYVSPGQIVIDIGINTVSGSKMEEEVDPEAGPDGTVGAGGKRKIVGDVDFEDVKDVVSAITPVPGGIGPLTVASLFQNLIDAYQKLR